MSQDKIKVILVCMGNICRSPLAKVILCDTLTKRNLIDNFIIDSAGTISYHVGEDADCRSIAIAAKHGLKMQHKARQLTKADIEFYDFIMVMDSKNYYDVLDIAMDSSNKIYYLRKFNPESNVADLSIPDPYYGDEQDFELVYQLCQNSINGFIQFLEEQKYL